MTQPDEETTPIVPPVAPEAPGPDDEPFDRERAAAKIAKANREAQQLRERLKTLEPLAQKAQELEDAQKSEAQRATEALTAAMKRAAEAEVALMRREVADEKGLTPAQAKRLVGTTREELLADADDYIAALPAPVEPPAPPTQRTPVEALRPGALPNAPEPSLQEQILAAQLVGDVKKVIRLNGQLLANQKK